MAPRIHPLKLRKALAFGALNAAASVIPVGRLPRGPLVIGGGVIAGVATAAGMTVLDRRRQAGSDDAGPAGIDDVGSAGAARHVDAAGEWPKRTEAGEAVRTETAVVPPLPPQAIVVVSCMAGVFGAGAIWLTAATDAGLERWLGRRGAEHPRVWIVVAGGVLGTVTELIDDGGPLTAPTAPTVPADSWSSAP